MRFLYTFILLIIVKFAVAQIQQGGQPLTIQHQISTNDIPFLRYHAPDIAILEAEDQLNDVVKGRQRIATTIDININFFNHAMKTIIDNQTVYRLAISAKQAEALSFSFDNFKLKKGDRFFIFNTNHTQTLGAFTTKNNHKSRQFTTRLISGTNIILEYIPGNINQIATIELNQINYAYRNTGHSIKRNFGDSDYCEVNVNCSEGDNWQNQRDATVRILIKEGNDIFWCTGVLVNNTREDCTPYLITAEHCSLNPRPNDLNQWIFYFNYQSPDCSNPTSEGNLDNNTLTGAMLKAKSNDNGGDDGSDFLLLELNDTIPTNYNAYYAGWDITDNNATSGVSIHHPNGDIKKISTFTNGATSSSFGGTFLNTHWELKWVSTSNGAGVTELGSSGSPLFNQNKKLIGTLTGGGALCNNLQNPDFYGQLAYSWASNGDSNNRQLQPWLDPDNTGKKILNGTAYPCEPREDPENITVSIFPNPVQDQITIKWDSPANSSSIRVLDLLGRELFTINEIQNETSFPFPSMISGMYILEIQLDETKITEKILVL